ncbi:hypothetical protein GIB67_010067 [Kingdonia uniflora]|uniref:Uncharacterized protein n=1 Tax=Kingdonia uniflora TaxID=39325 RepID=A0A7J7PAS0_9MAGN|nr:hypothetical protein GIB67_010067 [Kingdonia uniflora]
MEKNVIDKFCVYSGRQYSTTPWAVPFSTPEGENRNTNEIGGKKKEDGKRMKGRRWAEKKKGKENKQKKAKKLRVPRKRRVEFPELENIQSTAKNFLQQVTPREGLEVVNNLMVDDDVEVGREVNFKAISFEYGGNFLEWKKGDEKDNDENKDVEEKVKSEEEQPQVAEEFRTTNCSEVAKTDIVFFNQKEVVGEAYQANADQTTVVSVEEQTLKASADQTTIISVEEQTIEVTQTEKVISHQEEDVGEASQSKESKEKVEQNKEELVLKESKVDVTLKKRHALTEEEINERTFKMACQINQLHAHLDELLPGVLLESFIQRPISQDEKNQVDQVWSLRKDELSPKAKKENMSTYSRISEENVCLNALYSLYPNQWLDNEVIDVYIITLI